MATETEEREVKLDVGLQFALPDLTGVVDGVTEAELPRAELVATYFDTPDQRLLEQGITLRHRRDRVNPQEENQWTLKLPSGTGSGAAMQRTEYSWPGEADTVPYEAQHLVRAIVRHAPLSPVAELITSRRRILVKGAAGQPLAEIDDDTVAVMDGLRLAERFRQVEVELQASDEAVLDSVVGRLVAAGAVVGTPRPKLAQALGLEALPSGGGRGPVLPKKRGQRTLGQVVTSSISSALDRLIRHDAIVRLDADPEGVHQARVATRRLRSDLRTFRDALDPDWTAEIRGELKWLASALGEVRDADVLAQRLKGEAASHLREDDQKGFKDLLERLAGQRQAARMRLLEVLDSERYLDLLDELSVAATSPPFREGADVDARTRADKATIPLVLRPWKRLRKAVTGLSPSPDDQALHQVRIKAKRARYAAEAAAVAVGKPAERFAKVVAELQDVLGDHHDAVTAEAWLREAGAAGTAANEAVFVSGELVTVERNQQASLRNAWPSVWDRLSKRRLTAWVN